MAGRDFRRGAPNRRGLNAKRRALKIDLLHIQSERVALCAMRYFLRESACGGLIKTKRKRTISGWKLIK